MTDESACKKYWAFTIGFLGTFAVLLLAGIASEVWPQSGKPTAPDAVTKASAAVKVAQQRAAEAKAKWMLANEELAVATASLKLAVASAEFERAEARRDEVARGMAAPPVVAADVEPKGKDGKGDAAGEFLKKLDSEAKGKPAEDSK